MGEEVFIDTNIFLEIFLDDSKSEECKKFLQSLEEQDKQAVTTDFTVYSCILVIQHNLKNTNFIKNAIIFFNNLHNLKVLRPSFDEFYNAIKIMETNNLDFDDGLVIACMRNNKIKQLASLDKHFDKVKEIERIKI